MHVHARERIERAVAAGRGEHAPAVHAPHHARDRARRAPGGELRDERGCRPLAIARHSVLDPSSSLRASGATPNAAPPAITCEAGALSRSRGEQRCRSRRVVLQRNEIAVVNVAHRQADHVGAKFLRGLARRAVRIAREAEVEHAHIVARVIEGGGDARHAVRNHGHGLALPIRAHEQHPRACAHEIPVSAAARARPSTPRLPQVCTRR